MSLMCRGHSQISITENFIVFRIALCTDELTYYYSRTFRNDNGSVHFVRFDCVCECVLPGGGEWSLFNQLANECVYGMALVDLE